MKFLQVIEYTTSQFDEVSKMIDQWVEQTQGRRTAIRGYTGRDREQPNRYIDVIVFPSYQEAMRNNELPETQAMAEQWMKLCDGEPTFYNLDVVREDDFA
jgi:phage protein U